jgi:hypothetical protein
MYRICGEKRLSSLFPRRRHRTIREKTMRLFVSTALKAEDIRNLLEGYKEGGVSYSFIKKTGLKMEFEVSGVEGQNAVDLTKKIIRSTEYGRVLFFSVSGL